MSRPKVLETEILYDTFFRLKRELLEIPNEEDYNYYILVAPPVSVIVLAKTEEDEYVLNWEYRHPVGKELLSAPGGIKHDDECPIECAKRELLEETGYVAEGFEEIGEAYPFPGVCNQKTIYVRAKNAKKVTSCQLEPAELIETILISSERLKKMIDEGALLDGLLLAALFFLGRIID